MIIILLWHNWPLSSSADYSYSCEWWRAKAWSVTIYGETRNSFEELTGHADLFTLLSIVSSRPCISFITGYTCHHMCWYTNVLNNVGTVNHHIWRHWSVDTIRHLCYGIKWTLVMMHCLASTGTTNNSRVWRQCVYTAHELSAAPGAV